MIISLSVTLYLPSGGRFRFGSGFSGCRPCGMARRLGLGVTSHNRAMVSDDGFALAGLEDTAAEVRRGSF